AQPIRFRIRFHAFTLPLLCCVCFAVLFGCAGKKRVKLPPPTPARVGWTQRGIASWYGHPYHGRRTSSGEVYDMDKLTAAHLSLPFGTWVRVTNLANNNSVEVKINDRGPFIKRRIIDLSRHAFGLRTVLSTEGSGDSGEVTWAAGFDLDFQRDDRVENANVAGTSGALTKDQFETVTAAGFFLQASAPLGDRASLLGGVRYDRFDFGVEDRLGDGTGDRVMDAVSPTVGLVVQASPTLSVFSNFASSLATPTTTELGNTIDGTGGFNPDLDPQTGNTGEIGMRGQASSRFGYEASVFLSKLKNELVAFQDSTQDGRDFFRNAGKSTHKGFEASFRAVLPEGVYGQIAYTFVDAKFDEFVVDGEDLAGNFIPGLAKHRFEGLVRVSRGTWFGEIRGDHVGKIYTNDANSPNTAAKNYTLWDVRTGLTGQRVGNIQVAPFVSLTNIFNEVYSAAVAVNAFGSRYFEPGPRRAFSAGLTATF
ncbi:MAG: TonB-dependent receptor, partial [Gemmatimonadetes bacterium]|nr:TonB-dependent receptor [Gemmatimonadota bacterium]